MRKRLIITLLAMLPACAHAQLITHYLRVDTTRQTEAFESTITRGSTPYFRVQILNNGSAVTNLGSYGVYMFYATNGNASSGVLIQGTASDNTNGYAYLQFTTDQALGISSNASDYPASYWCQVVVTNATAMYDWSQGRLRFRSGGAIEGAATVTQTAAERDPVFGSWLETNTYSAVEDLVAREGVYTNAYEIAILSNGWDTLTSALNELQSLGSNYLTSVQCSGGWYNPDWFTLDLDPYPLTVISYGDTQTMNNVCYSDVSVDSAAGYLLRPDIVRMSTFTGGVTYAAISNCTIGEITTTNTTADGQQIEEHSSVLFVEGIQTGDVASFTASLNSFQRTTSVVYLATNVMTYKQYVGDVPGTLRAYVNTSLAARASVSNRTMNLFADGWPATWTRETNCWADGIDLTCASPYNTQGNPEEKGGTAITPQHVIYAAHYSFTNAARLLFVDATNGLFWRAIADQRTIPGTDARVGLLDTPLPATIHPALFMQPSDNGRFLGALDLSGGIGIRTITFKAVSNSWPKVFVKWACYGMANIDAYGIAASDLALIGRYDTNSPYAQPTMLGDSGQPTFISIGTNTVVYSAFLSSVGGPNYAYLCESIETAIREMDNSTYTNLTYVDLVDWQDYNLPPTF